MTSGSLVDIHCHLLPAIDDGSRSWEETLAMAQMAVSDGISAIIVTPHQLGSYAHNGGDAVRQRTIELRRFLEEHQVPLQVAPGADVRIEPEMIAQLRSGEVLTLGDHRRHVLLELPHEMYFALEGILQQLESLGMVGILSHPERNQGILKQPKVLESLVDQGCLMQVTAGSLLGTFGPACRQLSEWMFERNLVHFVASDAHGPRSRRPLLAQAQQSVARLTDSSLADLVCCRNPTAVFEGHHVEQLPRRDQNRKPFGSWLPWRKAA